MTAGEQPQKSTPSAAKIISFVALLAIVALFGALFFRVMAFFLLPAFLAVILVVVFRPLQLWMVQVCKGRLRLAAGLTTATILLIVLLPMLLLLANAAAEGWALYKGTQANADQDGVSSLLDKGRSRLGLELPPQQICDDVDDLDAFLADIHVEIEPGTETPDHRKIAKGLRPKVRQVRDWASQAKAARHRTEKSLFPRPNLDKAVHEAQNLDRQLAGLATAARDAPEFPKLLRDAQKSAEQLKKALVGNTLEYWLRDKANPDKKELESLKTTLRSYLAPAARNTGEALLKFCVGLSVMIIALYYFLADGPAMLHSVLAMSPLDERYEKQLLAEFAKISRAVVLATLLSAVTQGVLAGIGFKLAGLHAVFLLALLSMFLAMVPFVGAAAVWIPCAAWLFLDGHPMAGIFLAVYGIAVISMADNLIKPLVLHGQSNLHPLLALLSVLGGVQALGPIGIFVGPMAVVFLQTVLQMLQSELKSLGAKE